MRLATLALIMKGQQVLLGKKGKGVEIGEGTLNGPGGKLNPEKDGDSLVTCVIREVQEEVGLTLIPDYLEKVSVITFYAADVPDFEVHVFRTSVFGGLPQATEEMVPGWYDLTEDTFAHMLESDPEWLPQLTRGEKFNARVYYRERAKGFERIEFLPFLG